ncbi:MAG: M1 family metallopeptidase, partial [Gemmatimonadetes bacterium]|nr:M1 family metallopeptidase [Gemmatimonadota bacterium]
MRLLSLVVALTLAGCAATGGRGAGDGSLGTGGRGSSAGGALPDGGIPRRPLPSRMVPIPAFQQATENGTRTTRGEPGPRYWQQWAEYDLTARVFPDEKRVEGRAQIAYTNNSPDSLPQLVLELIQNVHAPGAMRNGPQEVTGGIQLGSVSVDGRKLPLGASPPGLPSPGQGATAGPRYVTLGTQLIILPPRAVRAGETVQLDIDWTFKVAQQGAGGRMGWSRDNLLFLAYWYPQMAVYDDVVGWHTDPFLGQAEFYADFGNYDYTVEAPAGWIVLGTGQLQNAEQVLAQPVLERLRRAETSDEVVPVLAKTDFAAATLPGAEGRLSWHFKADSVRDVAFSVTRESAWDAARTPVGDRDGDGRTDYARVDALYREEAPRWANVARYAQHSVRTLSELTGLSYPWSHMSVIEAAEIIGGGMEFPMMTIIGDYNAQGDSALYNVTVHEIAHMWVPMTLSSDERRYSWLDEGTTTFNENGARFDFFPGSDPFFGDWQEYLEVAQAGLEGQMMWPSDYQPPQAFTVASYSKPASVLRALQGVLGDETFRRGYHALYDRWAWKHPYPWDLFNTFESVSGRDLDWFWQSWYYETWLLDQAIGSVTSSGKGTRIVVEDRGELPMPVHLTITRADGETLRRDVAVETWLRGATSATVNVPAGSPVTRVEIDAGRYFPDADRENNVWT